MDQSLYRVSHSAGSMLYSKLVVMMVVDIGLFKNYYVLIANFNWGFGERCRQWEPYKDYTRNPVLIQPDLRGGRWWSHFWAGRRYHWLQPKPQGGGRGQPSWCWPPSWSTGLWHQNARKCLGFSKHAHMHYLQIAKSLFVSIKTPQLSEGLPEWCVFHERYLCTSVLLKSWTSSFLQRLHLNLFALALFKEFRHTF